MPCPEPWVRPMRRRDFISLVGGVVAWPLAGQAQQGTQVRHVGVLIDGVETDVEVAARRAAFQNALKGLGWNPDTNLRIDVRFGVGDDSLRDRAKELVGLTPDVILAMAPPSVIALRKITRSVPIIFAAVTDPVGLGIVQILSHPGGNATGFLSAEFGFGAKLLEMLREISPEFRKVIVFADLDNRSGAPQFAAIQAVAPAAGVEVSLLGVDDSALIERRISDLARTGNGGLIALRLTEVILHRELIIKLAAQHHVPAVYPLRIFATDGGLISYGPDVVDQFRQAASYVDRVLKGEMPADLPVQAPTKYNLVINLKTAKALGLSVRQSLLARADEVIE
jgi:putative tryptophan/tyrosine transport system substrate-binding protein